MCLEEDELNFVELKNKMLLDAQHSEQYSIYFLSADAWNCCGGNGEERKHFEESLSKKCWYHLCACVHHCYWLLRRMV